MASINDRVDQAGQTGQANRNNGKESGEQQPLDFVYVDHHLGLNDGTSEECDRALSLAYIDHDLQSSTVSQKTEDPANASRAATRPTLATTYLDHYYDSKYNARNFIIPAQPPTGLFRLPPEIRLMTWKHLLPGRRIFQSKGRLGLPDSLHPVDTRRPRREESNLELRCPVFQPVLSKICRESRAFLLTHGVFIFQKSDEEGGFWWNSERDVLLLDHRQSMCFELSTPDVRGWEHVHNVALDAEQARYVGCAIAYDGDEDEKEYGSARERQPIDVTAGLAFYASCDIPRFFYKFAEQFTSLTMIFTAMCDSPHQDEEETSTLCQEEMCTITFRLGHRGDDLQTAIDKLVKYRLLALDLDHSNRGFSSQPAPVAEPTSCLIRVYWYKDGSIVGRALDWISVTREDLMFFRWDTL